VYATIADVATCPPTDPAVWVTASGDHASRFGDTAPYAPDDPITDSVSGYAPQPVIRA